MRDASLFRRSDMLAWLIVNPIQRVLAVWSLGSYLLRERRLLNGT